MNFDYTEEQTLLDNMVTSFVRDNYDWDTRCNIVKSEEGWKEENWKQFAELGLLGVPFDEAYGGLGGKSTDLMIVMEQFGKGLVVEPYLPNNKIGILHLAAGIWKNGIDMRLDKSIEIEIKTLTNKKINKSLRFDT